MYQLDHCDTESLKTKYLQDNNVSHLASNIQHVDFVYDGSPIETLIYPTLRFDYIYSSHAIEHQVNFVEHLRSLEKIIKQQGRIILIIPDLRSCFDSFRFPTVTSDVLEIYVRNQSIHQGKQLFEFLSQCIDINPGRVITRHELKNANFSNSKKYAYDILCDAEKVRAIYKDVHSWTFTPLSFSLLLIELFLIDLNFSCLAFSRQFF